LASFGAREEKIHITPPGSEDMLYKAMKMNTRHGSHSALVA
jgi:hypothetical protein